MIKLFVMICAILGAYFVLPLFITSLNHHAMTFAGVDFSWAAVVAIIVGILALRLKSK